MASAEEAVSAQEAAATAALAAVADAEAAAPAPAPKCWAKNATECSDAAGCVWCRSALNKTKDSCVSAARSQWLPPAIFK